MVSTIERFHCIQDSLLGPSGVHYREVLLYTGQLAGPSGVHYREVPLYTGQPNPLYTVSVKLQLNNTYIGLGIRYPYKGGDLPLNPIGSVEFELNR